MVLPYNYHVSTLCFSYLVQQHLHGPLVLLGLLLVGFLVIVRIGLLGTVVVVFFLLVRLQQRVQRDRESKRVRFSGSRKRIGQMHGLEKSPVCVLLFRLSIVLFASLLHSWRL